MTRAEKSQVLIDDCISKMNDDDKLVYRPIAEYAVDLGYTPKPIKTAGGNADELAFSKSKVSRTILRIRPRSDKTYAKYETQAGKAQMRLIFFATPVYSEIFRRGIKSTIEAFDFKYTGCYGCGRCKGDEGYIYIYPDGKTFFRCGCELIALPPIGVEHIEEIKTMMKTQDDFWIKKAEEKEKSK